MAEQTILIINGPNLGRLGERQPEIYGSKSLDDLPELISQAIGEQRPSLQFKYFQSNSEGSIIDRIEQAYDDKVDGMVINAGAFTHTSLAIGDCLAWVSIPCVEVHLSNVLARQSHRHVSFIAPHSIGVISGFGLSSYVLAVQALIAHLS